MEAFLVFDVSATRFLQLFQTGWLTGFMRVVSAVSDTQAYFLLVPALALYLHRRGWRRPALAVVLATAGNILNPVLKNIIARPRPTTDLVAVLDTGNGGFSFPSGHALGALIFYGLLIYFSRTVPGFPFRKVLPWIAGAFILLVGVSRIYLGAHWFSDVLAGYVLGGLWLVLVAYWHDKKPTKH